MLKVGQGIADPVEDRQPRFGVGRQRRRRSRRQLVGAQRAAHVVARARASSRSDQTEVLAKAEGRRRQIRAGLLAAFVVEETGHGVGRRLAQAGGW